MFVAGPVLVLIFTVSCILTFSICSGGIGLGGVTFRPVTCWASGLVLSSLHHSEVDSLNRYPSLGCYRVGFPYCYERDRVIQ